jgi:flagellar biosynthesis protein FlhB
MAEENKDQEKTEQATPKRKQDAREKGQVAKSRELASVAILGACLIYFYFGASHMFAKMSQLMRTYLIQSGQLSVSLDNIHSIILDFIYQAFIILFPFLLVAVLAGFIANILQVGFLFSSEAIMPKFSKIDPIKGFQRLFSAQSLVELVKSVAKILIVGFVAYLTMKSESDKILPLMQYSVPDILAYISRVSFKILYTTSLILLVIAILDYVYQKWEMERSLKMTKQEIKEENKESEGDPLVKGRIRRLQRDIARKRMMAQVPKADVVITNPTHFAVAISYVPEKMNAPVVIAKGADFLAEKIKEIAKIHNVPIVENKAVAQVLYRIVDIEQAVPETLYKAIAEILVYVYSLKQKRMYS